VGGDRDLHRSGRTSSSATPTTASASSRPTTACSIRGRWSCSADDAIHPSTTRSTVSPAQSTYGGDFGASRAASGVGRRVEQPYDFDFVLRTFAEANTRANATS
jgi:hypothetical protein